MEYLIDYITKKVFNKGFSISLGNSTNNMFYSNVNYKLAERLAENFQIFTPAIECVANEIRIFSSFFEFRGCSFNEFNISTSNNLVMLFLSKPIQIGSKTSEDYNRESYLPNIDRSWQSIIYPNNEFNSNEIIYLQKPFSTIELISKIFGINLYILNTLIEETIFKELI